MDREPNFYISSRNDISQKFTELGIYNFQEAAKFIRMLPYGRNTDKNDLSTVFNENRGTCSTKHALLKQLSDENNFHGLILYIGVFKMNEENTPAIAMTLKRNNLEYIPEAHCYLKFNDIILDFTKRNSSPTDFINELIEEIEIFPDQITDFKTNYHKSFLMNWLKKANLNLSLNELWTIREQCIHDLEEN